VLANDENLAPKITGMLIDFDVFEKEDMIELMENNEILIEKIAEAEELIADNPEVVV
jgi:hypothetical protein